MAGWPFSSLSFCVVYELFTPVLFVVRGTTRQLSNAELTSGGIYGSSSREAGMQIFEYYCYIHSHSRKNNIKNEPGQCTLCKPSQELETKQLPVVSVDWRFPGLNWPVPNSWLGLKLHVG